MFSHRQLLPESNKRLGYSHIPKLQHEPWHSTFRNSTQPNLTVYCASNRYNILHKRFLPTGLLHYFYDNKNVKHTTRRDISVSYLKYDPNKIYFLALNMGFQYLILRRRVLLQKLMVTQLPKKLCTFYGT